MNIDPDVISFSHNQIEAATGRARLARSARRGQAQRVARGAYVPSDTWTAQDARQQYLLRIVAVARTRRMRPVISHQSAAAIHGLPLLEAWPLAVHITVPPTVGSHSRSTLAKHTAPLAQEDVVERAGILVTSVARTVLDIAGSASFASGVVAADSALLIDRYGKRAPLVSRQELEQAWSRAQPLRAHARTKAVFAFAETRSETPIESVSRVNMRVIGVPRPRLQVPLYDAKGFIGEPDFTWDEFAAVAEADGDRKYLDERYRGGRSPEQVFLDEKIREDRLRALPRSLTRWRWSVAISPTLLAGKLVALGLPTGQKW